MIRVRAFLVVLLIVAFAWPVMAEPSSEDEVRQNELVERVARLRRDPSAKAQVETAIEQAELALSRARAARERGDLDAVARAFDIAAAAATLAERRRELWRERELAGVIAQRKREAQERAAFLKAEITRVKSSARDAEKLP